MSILPIVIYPGPVLRVTCKAAQLDDAVALQGLAGDMLETMYAAKGRGLAAPQVGETLRLFVFDATWKEGAYAPYVCINPIVTPVGVTVATGEEQCLSIPDRPVEVERATSVEMAWFDAELKQHQQVFDGAAAVIIQHEADHLDGRLILDVLEAAQ